MPATATETEVITRTVEIAASPETVYSFLADPARMATWLGRRVEADPRPGGLLRIDYNGFDIMRGTFLELVPHSRVVWSWGWESLSTSQTPPAGSTVEISLEPDGNGTRLSLRHSGLQAQEIAAHGAGWDFFVQNLASIVRGGPVQQMAGELTLSEEFASQLNSTLVRVIDVLEHAPDDAWLRPVANDGRPAVAVANHIAGHLGLASFAVATANGEKSPFADFTGEDIEKMNAEDARSALTMTRAEVVAKIRQAGPEAVEALRGIPAAGLARTQALGAAGGAQVSAEALIQGPLLGDVRGHLAGLEAALSAA